MKDIKSTGIEVGIPSFAEAKQILDKVCSSVNSKSDSVKWDTASLLSKAETLLEHHRKIYQISKNPIKSKEAWEIMMKTLLEIDYLMWL